MKILLISIVLLTTACSSTPDTKSVIPLKNNEYELTMFSSDKESSLENALASAKETCFQLRQRFFIIKQESKYKGYLEESANSTAKFISNIINIPNFSGNKDYSTYLKFKCNE